MDAIHPSSDHPHLTNPARLALGVSCAAVAHYGWRLGRGAWMLGRRHGPEPTPLRQPPPYRRS